MLVFVKGWNPPNWPSPRELSSSPPKFLDMGWITFAKLREGETFQLAGLGEEFVELSGLEQMVYFLFDEFLRFLGSGSGDHEEVDVWIQVNVVEEAHALVIIITRNTIL